MKKLALSSLLVVLFGISNSAFAKSNFDGIYLGLGAGYARADDKGMEYKNYGATYEGVTQRTHPEGTLFSLFTGINKVVDKNILFGAEADYDKRSYSNYGAQTFSGTTLSVFPVQTKLKNGGSLRARFGYIFNNDKTLAYITAGYTTLKVVRSYGDVNGALGNGTWYKTDARNEGYVGGFGLEHFLTDKISLRAEYRYAKYNTKKVDSSFIYSPGTLEKQSLRDQSFRIGIAYNF